MDHSSYIRIVPGAKCAVLMIHGIVCTPRHFDFLLSSIPEDWSICNILLDGHGGTVRDFSNTSMEQWQKQVNSWLEKLCATHEKVLVVGYSLGTLLTLSNYEKYPQVKGLLLMQPPLVAWVKLRMWIQSTFFTFHRVRLDDPMELALYYDISVKLKPGPFWYIGWIPRFYELLVLSRKCRPIAQRISIPTVAFLSKKDELVSLRSAKYLRNNPNVRLYFLEKGGHSYYPPEDQEAMHQALREFVAIAERTHGC